jgi:hypothetical protein
MTQTFSVTATADHHLDARQPRLERPNLTEGDRRSEHTLRQTVIALAQGQALRTQLPGRGTLYLLTGRIQGSAGDLYWDGTHGAPIIIPNGRPTLHALEDAAELLTVAKTQTS